MDSNGLNKSLINPPTKKSDSQQPALKLDDEICILP